MNQKMKLLIAFLPDLFPGTSRRLWERRAAAGHLGPVHAEEGKSRNCTVERTEIERRFGAISEERFTAAQAAYQTHRRVIRKVEQ
jgi:hypothetical protein